MYACATVNASAGSDVKGKEGDNTSVSRVTQSDNSAGVMFTTVMGVMW